MATIIVKRRTDGRVGRCDATCHNSKSAKCDCVCRGRYHGPQGELQRLEDFMTDVEVAATAFKEAFGFAPLAF
jgi:hypothetical protein